MKRKYLLNSILTTGSLIFTRVVEFVLIAILTRMITTYEYGEYSLFNSWVNILSIVIGGSISSSFGIAKKDFKEQYNRYLSSCVGLSYVFLIASFAIGFIVNKSWDTYYLCLIVLHSFNMNILTNYDVTLMFDKRFIKASVVNIIKSVFSFGMILAGVLILRTSNQGLVAIVMLFISYLAISIYAQVSMFAETRCFYDKQFWSYAVKNSYLMIFHNLSLVVLNQMDRIMISELLDNSYVAIYSIIYSLSVVMSILWTGINRVWQPWLYDAFERKEIGRIRRINSYLILVIAFLTINYCFITPEIIKLFFKKTYWDGINMMPLILFGYFFSFLFSISVNIEYCDKRIKWITPGTIMSAAVNTATNLWFIPIFGYKAAAYTTLLSYFSLFAYHYVINFKYKYLDNKVLWITIVLLTVILGVCVVLSRNWFVRYLILLCFDFIVVLAGNRFLRDYNYNLKEMAKTFLKID